jgi:hypothetical protein
MRTSASCSPRRWSGSASSAACSPSCEETQQLGLIKAEKEAAMRRLLVPRGEEDNE